MNDKRMELGFIILFVLVPLCAAYNACQVIEDHRGAVVRIRQDLSSLETTVLHQRRGDVVREDISEATLGGKCQVFGQGCRLNSLNHFGRNTITYACECPVAE